MEFVQERVATLHAFEDPIPDAPLDRTAVVVPMTGREYAGLAAERVLSTLEGLDPALVVVPIRAPESKRANVRTWLDGFDLPLRAIWCGGDEVESLLAEAGLAGPGGKGRDVWLALGPAAEAAEYVVVHDADATTYGPAHVPRLCGPLADGFSFVKGYYARVENGRLYGRLGRLFVAPLIDTLSETTDAPILEYLEAFRYPLAGEFAATSDLARTFAPPRRWGLELGTLGTAFDVAGFERSAQVDLGRHEHDHRAVAGPTGLSEMAEQVGSTLFTVLEARGVEVEYDGLPGRYRATAERYIRQYGADARFNGLAYDAEAEREQVDAYAGAVREPGPVDRLPPWLEVDLEPEDVLSVGSL